MISFQAFSDEFEKIAGLSSAAKSVGNWASKNSDNLYHGAEIAGLGTLAAPAIAEMSGKHVSDKTKRRAEVGGLGILAVPSALHFKNLVKKASNPVGLTARLVKNMGVAPKLTIKPIIPKVK